MIINDSIKWRLYVAVANFIYIVMISYLIRLIMGHFYKDTIIGNAYNEKRSIVIVGKILNNIIFFI